MGGELEIDEATVRAVAAALMDSVAELIRLADRLDVTVRYEGGRLADVVRQWAERTAADAAALSGTVDAYSESDHASAVVLGRTDA